MHTTVRSDYIPGLDRDTLLSIEDAASLLGVTPRMVRRLTAERRLPHVKIGRHVRVRRSALEAFVTESTRPATRPVVGRYGS
jgi:excisionase family DNA binding protein